MSKANGLQKQAQNIFWLFGVFRIEGQKLDLVLVTKYIKNQSHPNMLVIKVGRPFSYSQMKISERLTMKVRIQL